MIHLGQNEHGYRLPRMPEYYSGRLRRLPRWANMWMKRPVIFSFEEREWRVVSSGSHNNTPERQRWSYLTRSERRIGTHVEYVTAISTDAKEETLPTAPCELSGLAAALTNVQAQGRRFTPDMLRHATHIKWWKS